MPRDASGNYTLPAGNPVVTGTVITSSWANPTMADLAAEITGSLSRSGQGGMLVPFEFLDGSINSPGITFTNEPTVGIFRASAGVLGIAAQGVAVALFKGVTGNVEIDAPLPIEAGDLTRKDYVDSQTGGGILAIFDALYPVGSHKVGGDPNGIIPGTWVQLAEGTFLMNTVAGADAAGGSNEAVVIEHDHGGNVDLGGGHGHVTNNPAHGHTVPKSTSGGSSDRCDQGGTGGVGVINANTTVTAISVDDAADHQHVVPSDGVDGANLNRPLYVGVEVWERTA